MGNNEIKVKGITIQIKNKEFVLTPEEAKQLKNALTEILGPQIINHWPTIWYNGGGCGGGGSYDYTLTNTAGNSTTIVVSAS